MIGTLLVVLLIGAAVLFFFAQKRRNDNNSEKEKERSDINPVYGTYEVHYDPVAEVIDKFFPTKTNK